MRFSPVTIVSSIAVMASAAPCHASTDEAAADSAFSCSWEAVYDATAHFRREAGVFPWNEPADSSHLADRGVLMLGAGRAGWRVFMKASTGLRGHGDGACESRLLLDQGHISFTGDDLLQGRLFIRERMFGTASRLSFPVSNDSPFLSGSTEGAVLTLGSDAAMVRYTGAATGEPDERLYYGGFPSLHGPAGSLNMVAVSAAGERLYGEMTVLEMRSGAYGDAAMIRGGTGVRVGEAMLGVEYALSSDTGWDDLGRPSGPEGKGTGSILPRNAFFAAGVWGLELDAGRAGVYGLAPGYRFAGNEFAEGPGEIERGTVESFLDLWWRHPELSLILDLDLAESWRSGMGESERSAVFSVWTRFLGGFESRETVVLTSGERAALALGLTDDNGLARVSASARVDDAGGKNELSFLADAGINLGSRWLVGGTLYLERSRRGFYSADIEVRDGRRFLVRVSAGSFVPWSGSVTLTGEGPPVPVQGERFVSVQARFTLGGLR